MNTATARIAETVKIADGIISTEPPVATMARALINKNGTTMTLDPDVFTPAVMAKILQLGSLSNEDINRLAAMASVTPLSDGTHSSSTSITMSNGVVIAAA